MKKEQKQLLEIIKYNFWKDADLQILQDIEWHSLFDEAGKNRMLTFVYEALYELSTQKAIPEPPADLMNVLKGYSFQVFGRNGMAISIQQEIVKKFVENEVSFCMLKGTSLSINYPKPMLRELGDMDIYVKSDEIDKAISVLNDSGFQYETTNTDYHTSYIKNGFEIELHNSIPGLPVGRSRNQLGFIKNMPERGIKIEDDFSNTVIPNVCDNGIVQLLHMLHHTCTKGMNLRLFIDWMMFVNANLSDEVWEHEVRETYETVGLDRMAKIVTKICKEYIGLEGITWCDGISAEDCKQYLEFVLAGTEAEIQRKRSASYVTELSSDTWDEKEKNPFVRNVKRIVSGQLTLGRACEIYREKKAIERFLINLKLFDSGRAFEYSFQ